MIETAIPVTYNGFAVGYPVPAAYPGYAVPPLYSDLYYAQPGYDYRYANGGIYQIDPQTRMVEAIAALLTGQTFGVGQMLPAGYDAYNVPYAYRSQYYRHGGQLVPLCRRQHLPGRPPQPGYPDRDDRSPDDAWPA